MAETDERDMGLPAFCACVLGLSIVWLFFRGDLAVRALALTDAGPGGAGMLGYYLCIGTMVVAAALVPLLLRLFSPRRGAILRSTTAVSSLGALAMLLSCFLQGTPALALGCAGSVLLGMYIVTAVLCWGSLLAGFPARRIVVLVSLAFALSSAISFISLFPQMVYLAMLALLPVASVGLYLLCIREADASRGAGAEDALAAELPSRPAKASYSLVVVLAVFCVVGFSIRGLVAPLEASAPMLEMVLVNVATALVGCACALMGWRMKSVQTCVLLITRLLMVGLFAALCLSIVLGASPYADVINGVSLVARAGITYALFLVACLYSRWYMEDRLFGMGILFMLPQAVASTVRSLLFQFETALGDYTSLFAPVMLFVLAIALLSLTLKRADGAGKPGGEGRRFGDREDHGQPYIDAAMARRWGLTPRESDIANCLARGYTLQKTADELFVSMNTVRTHAKAVYRKMGVASKQELIDAVERLNRP